MYKVLINDIEVLQGVAFEFIGATVTTDEGSVTAVSGDKVEVISPLGRCVHAMEIE